MGVNAKKELNFMPRAKYVSQNSFVISNAEILSTKHVYHFNWRIGVSIKDTHLFMICVIWCVCSGWAIKYGK